MSRKGVRAPEKPQAFGEEGGTAKRTSPQTAGAEEKHIPTRREAMRANDLSYAPLNYNLTVYLHYYSAEKVHNSEECNKYKKP